MGGGNGGLLGGPAVRGKEDHKTHIGTALQEAMPQRQCAGAMAALHSPCHLPLLALPPFLTLPPLVTLLPLMQGLFAAFGDKKKSLEWVQKNNIAAFYEVCGHVSGMWQRACVQDFPSYPAVTVSALAD